MTLSLSSTNSVTRKSSSVTTSEYAGGRLSLAPHSSLYLEEKRKDGHARRRAWPEASDGHVVSARNAGAHSCSQTSAGEGRRNRSQGDHLRRGRMMLQKTRKVLTKN